MSRKVPESGTFNRTVRLAGEFAFTNGHFAGEEGTSMNQLESQRSPAASARFSRQTAVGHGTVNFVLSCIKAQW